jgi:hypothetical protein
VALYPSRVRSNEVLEDTSVISVLTPKLTRLVIPAIRPDALSGAKGTLFLNDAVVPPRHVRAVVLAIGVEPCLQDECSVFSPGPEDRSLFVNALDTREWLTVRVEQQTFIR